jgi:hypothetical protein
MAEATKLCIAVLEAAVLSFIADRITLLNSPNQLGVLLSIWRCTFSAVRATEVGPAGKDIKPEDEEPEDTEPEERPEDTAESWDIHGTIATV